ncbi:MAG: Ppx/GppA phosphatase family protein [Capsulimonadaceae bacterium]|nr:Ppx/GppA phosphatase family protein [Capsulimonadaceae bacterium]
MSLAAVIDVGTNSAKMAVADLDNGITIIQEESEITRLGKGVDAAGMLRVDAIERTLDAIDRFVALAKMAGARRTKVIGTSALRDAGNGQTFVDGLFARTGLTIEIVSGDREAQLAYGAIRSDASLGISSDEPLAVFDIGGGSTEITLGTGEQIRAHRSMNVGAVRVTERILHGDPPLERELRAGSQLAADILSDAPTLSSRIRGVGIGGTIVNIAAVSVGGAASVHGARLTREQIDGVLGLLAAKTVAERRAVPGLEPGRADVIVGGILVVCALMDRLGLSEVGVSTRGLRYGVLAEMA